MSRAAAILAAVILGSGTPILAQTAVAQQVEAGWEALRQGDGNKAATVFYDLLRQYPREAAFHFGAGVAARLQGRDTDAIASLTRALELNSKLIQASDLLGQLHYQQGDLDAAIRVYEQALTAAAGPPAMRARLDEWRKEAAVHAKLAVRTDARFSIIFDGQSDQMLATRASAVLDRAFWSIGQKIGTYPSNRIIVTLYTEQQFRDITHVPAWSSGAFDGKIHIPVKGVSQNLEEFDHVLVHELTHAIVHSLAPRGVPAWLHEGLATYFEPRDPALAQRRLQALRAVIPLSALEGSFSRLDAAQAAVAYDQSLFAADMLMRIVSARMGVLLQALGNGQSFDTSLGQLGMRAADFEAQVARRLRP